MWIFKLSTKRGLYGIWFERSKLKDLLLLEANELHFTPNSIDSHQKADSSKRQDANLLYNPCFDCLLAKDTALTRRCESNSNFGFAMF